MKISFINETKADIKEYILLINEIFQYEKINYRFSIIFVDDEKILFLNTMYRKRNYITDVITFALNDITDNGLNINELGDVFICLDQAKRQAIAYEHSLSREIGFLAVHGYLHLLGYDHLCEEDEKIMFNLQEEILNKVNLKR